MIKKFISICFKTLMFLFTLLSFALLFIAIFKKEWIEQALNYIENIVNQIGNWNYLIAFSSAGIESIPIVGGLLPGMNIMLLEGGIWGKQNLFLIIFMASLGAMIGNYFGYLIGKYYGEYLIKNYGDYIGIGKTERKILENQIQKNGFWYIVLGKFHGMLRAFIPFIAGAGKMGEKSFWIYNSIGSVVWAIVINLLGFYFFSERDLILDNMGKITTFILVLIILYLLIFKKEALKNYFYEKNKEIEEAIAEKEKSKNN